MNQVKTNAIEAINIERVFGPGGASSVRALDSISLAIHDNEFFTLLGPSGCGKTTLLRIIAGFDAPTGGDLLLFGQSIAATPPNKRPVNTVFQNYALFPHMTVAENIGFGLKMLQKPKSMIATRVEEMLHLVKMQDLAHRRTSELSGGQQQRVALARALAPQPKVLLLDEPLSALDYKLRKDMQVELKRLQHQTGITFIFVTHDQEEALTMSDRIAVMNKGRIQQVATPRAIYDQPANRFVASFIGEMNLLQGQVVASTAEQTTVGLPGGKKVTVQTRGAPVPAGKAVSIAVRPEHAKVVAADTADAIGGEVVTTVYFGTDTHIYLSLTDGAEFVLRRQNIGGEENTLAEGAKVAVLIDAAKAWILED